MWRKWSAKFIALKITKIGLYMRVRYGCLKITRCSEDSIKVGKHDNTWDNGDTLDNAT
jgi:hypothetical protein